MVVNCSQLDNTCPSGNPMRYIILCVLLALTTCLYADEPKSKAIRKYENEVEVLRKQGQAAIKRLEGVFEKEVENLREKTLKDLQKELDAALEAKDLDKAVALRDAIKAFEDEEASGLSAKVSDAVERRVKKRIPKEAVHFGGHRYLLVDRGIAWLAAVKEAERLGGHLVQIDSLPEHDFLIRLITSTAPQNAAHNIWIDASRLWGGREWRDTGGRPVNLSRMRCGGFDEPNALVLVLWSYDGWKVGDMSSPEGNHAYIIEWDN